MYNINSFCTINLTICIFNKQDMIMLSCTHCLGGNKMNKSKLTLITLIFIVVFMFSSCSSDKVITRNTLPKESPISSVETTQSSTEQNNTTQDSNSKFEVHYIDVGQADASLILCDDESMLIDGGNPEDSSLIVSYLNKHDIRHLDYVICTHAHDDHVGGLSGALSVVSVGSVYAPKTENDIRSYNSFKSKVTAQCLSINNPIPGSNINLGSSIVTFLGPLDENVEDLNDTSIILKITYGKTSFLITGDAERDAEQSVLAQDYDLSATVLKVGHHGSKDSTTYPFLREIMPEYAIISVGDNSYGHPTKEVLSRLSDAEVEIYRTDLHGDIIVTSNGETVTIKTSKNHKSNVTTTNKETTPIPSTNSSNKSYIGNKNSKKFHLKSCHSLPAEKNRIYFSSRNEAISNHFSPCKNCHP